MPSATEISPGMRSTAGLNGAIVTKRATCQEHPSATKWNELSQPHQVQGATELLNQLGEVLLQALATHLNTGL